MITIFNGRRRGLGEIPTSRVYAKIDIMFREYLHFFKGAKLAVLLAIALHADEDGWAWPSYETLQRETGYSENTIIHALAELCRLKIQGQRVLLRYQPTNRGQFASNRYLIFPSPEEVDRYEGAGVIHLGFASRSRTVTQKVGDGSPSPNPPSSVNWVTNHNHNKPEPDSQEEEEEEEKADKSENVNEIARVLQENGVFPENAARIADRMARAGLTAEEALGVYLLTLQQVTQQSLPDEQAVGRAVYRLEQGIWDAGERAREAIRHARYQDLSCGEAVPEEETPEPERLWQRALGELQLELTRATFETWLRGSRAIACEDGTFVIRVANTYAREWLESRLRTTVERALARVAGRSLSVRFVVHEYGNH
ncbi:MAG: helix-turn-helix domain-containing protein [Anaerolineae bacterium]